MKKLYYFHVAVHGDGELQSLLSKSTSQSKQQRVREREREREGIRYKDTEKIVAVGVEYIRQ